MYASTVGKTFLKEYNRRNDKNYSPKDFFDKVLFKYFFDNKRYLMWAQNSPFVQGLSKKKPFFEHVERLEKLNQFHEKIERGERDASIALGFPASEINGYATTSGLVTDLKVPSDNDEIYYSWIGGTLSLGVAGGYALLFDNPEITYATFMGWEVYRQYLNDTTLDKLRPNQIITWNGQWLTLFLDRRFPKDFDFNYFVRKKVIEMGKEKIEIKTVVWSNLFFSLSHQYPNSSQMAYVFALGQTNKTVGFIPFQLKSGKKITEVYQKLFGEENYQTNRVDFEELFGLHIKRACELGNIGLQALEPKGLRKYFSDSKNIKLVRPKINSKKEESEEDFEIRKKDILKKDHQNVITFQTYKTWLIAMLSKNKQEFLQYTEKMAQALVKYREGARKRDRATLIEKKIFGKRSKQDFIENLILIIQDDEVDESIISQVKELRDRVYLMSSEDFSYLWLLLKFDYAYQQRIS